MSYPLKFNGAGNIISAAMMNYVSAKVKAMDKPDVRLFITPAQLRRLCDVRSQIVLVESVEKSVKSNTFADVEIVQDPDMPADEIHWRDKDNVTVAKIIGLAV